MGNQHGHSLKERVVALAKEEEARRRAHFQRETKARKAPAGVKVDADKTVLFDFEASRDFAEQLSVRRDEVVHVLENCGVGRATRRRRLTRVHGGGQDGWSQISNSKQKRGVVPTSYLGPVIDKSKGSSFRQTADQRLQVLKEMAVSQASDKAWGLVGLCVWGVGALASNVLLPGADKLYRFFSRSESVRDGWLARWARGG
jgi:hypothetical protein